MVRFVHLTPEKNVDEILRSGITQLRRQDDHPKGIFAMPIARSFYISHQWLGELKERGHLLVAALYFRVPDSEFVWVGHYRHSHQRMTAAEAIAVFEREQRPEGFEVIIPRPIKPGQIHRIHHLARVFGWKRRPGKSKQRSAALGRRPSAA